MVSEFLRVLIPRTDLFPKTLKGIRVQNRRGDSKETGEIKVTTNRNILIKRRLMSTVGAWRNS